jgi:hypothetical protein
MSETIECIKMLICISLYIFMEIKSWLKAWLLFFTKYSRSIFFIENWRLMRLGKNISWPSYNLLFHYHLLLQCKTWMSETVKTNKTYYFHSRSMICSFSNHALSFLTIFTFAVPELLDLIWRKIGFLPYGAW